MFRKAKPKVHKKIKKTDKLKKKSVQNREFVKNVSLSVKYVEELNASAIQEGMLLLGIVSQVTEKVVNVSLPGTLRGTVTVPNISDGYTNMIQNLNSDNEVII